MPDSNLPIPGYLPSTGLSRTDRRVGRQVAEARAFGTVLSAREIAKIEAVGTTTQAALLAASQVSSLEGMLLNASPNVDPARLSRIAEAGCTEMAHIVMAMSQRLR